MTRDVAMQWLNWLEGRYQQLLHHLGLFGAHRYFEVMNEALRLRITPFLFPLARPLNGSCWMTSFLQI
jgi:hypothetical protein